MRWYSSFVSFEFLEIDLICLILYSHNFFLGFAPLVPHLYCFLILKYNDWCWLGSQSSWIVINTTSHHFFTNFLMLSCLPISRSCHGCAATDLLVMDEIILSLRGGCEEWWKMGLLFGVSFDGTSFATWKSNNQQHKSFSKHQSLI